LYRFTKVILACIVIIGYPQIFLVLMLYYYFTITVSYQYSNYSTNLNIILHILLK